MKRLSIPCAGLLLIALSIGVVVAQQDSPRARRSPAEVPNDILLRLVRAEDERRWDEDLIGSLTAKDAKVRRRAVLAAGRIGDERAVPALAEMLLTDRDSDVRQMAAFALGEIESPGGAFALISVLKNTAAPARARAVEALGKITAGLASNSPATADQGASPKPADDRPGIFRTAILDVLKFEAGRRSAPDRLTILLGLTAALRARPEGATPVITEFLGYSDPRIRADALNTLSRLRSKDANEQTRKLLIADPDPVVRANAARLLGAAEDKTSFDALLDRALHDDDLRVRVSAIRALGALKDERAAPQLFARTTGLILALKKDQSASHAIRRGIPPAPQNEWLELYTALGNILAGKGSAAGGFNAPSEPPPPSLVSWHTGRLIREFEISSANIEPGTYVNDLETYFSSTRDLRSTNGFFRDWRRGSNVAQGLGTIATMPVEEKGDQTRVRAEKLLLEMIKDRRSSALALSDMLTAYAAFKPAGLPSLLQQHLRNRDVVVRGTAAELLGGLPPDQANGRALLDTWKTELPGTEKGEMNDAALAILDALGKQKTAAANDAIKTALESSDHLLRRKAVAILKANGAGDFSARIGTVKTKNTETDHRRAIGRIGKKVRATVETTKGSFTIEFLPKEAPLTVDNFIQLARKGYFNGQTIPRVVPNFVVQAGDPRGDQNGGPGYQIRCELNEVPFERGAVGMALSGKDTGGSQWFVTHSPQPHLDGGYTVFGRVIAGMEVVDNIARGDMIRRVTVSERP